MCPICGNKTRDKIREDTELKNFPLYCPKCKQESLIDAKNLQITVIKEPDAKTQSRTCENKLPCVFLAPERAFYEFFEIDFWKKRAMGRI